MVSLDVSLCSKYSIHIDDLFVLYAQFTKSLDLINVILSEKKYKESINKLQSMGLSDGVHCLVPEIFGSFKDSFEELWKTYPSETPNGRKLKGNKDAAEKKYSKFLSKNPTSHKTVIMCLNKELDARNKNGSTEYIPTIVKWIESNGWEYYLEDTVNSETPQTTTPTSHILPW